VGVKVAHLWQGHIAVIQDNDKWIVVLFFLFDFEGKCGASINDKWQKEVALKCQLENNSCITNFLLSLQMRLK